MIGNDALAPYTDNDHDKYGSNKLTKLTNLRAQTRTLDSSMNVARLERLKVATDRRNSGLKGKAGELSSSFAVSGCDHLEK